MAKSAPDGYTVLLTVEGPATINVSVYPKLPFITMRDLPAVTQLIKYVHVAVINPSVPVTSVKELIARAKAQPGKMSYAHPGVGTSNHLAVELFKTKAGVDMISVPYKGGGPAVLAVIGNTKPSCPSPHRPQHYPM